MNGTTADVIEVCAIAICGTIAFVAYLYFQSKVYTQGKDKK